MGAVAAADMVNEGLRRQLVDFEQALLWHLSTNHFPPVPSEMLPVCLEAIDLAENDAWDDPVWLPDGVTFRGGPATCQDVVDSFHLHTFIHAG